MTQTDMEAVEALCVRLERTFAVFPHDNHGGYGECCGTGTVWVDDGMASNSYRGGTCPRCADNTPAPVNPDGPEAAKTIRALLSAYNERGRDAERFQALMRCPRIKMQGSAGVDARTGERNGNGVHFGAEFWPYAPKPEYAHLDGGDASTKWGQACIRALADAILEEEARALTPNTEGVG